MSTVALQNYIRISKYARYNKELKRRETWPEQVGRVMNMHRIRYANILPEIEEELKFIEDLFLQKKILGSMRAMQFADTPILIKNERIYNCGFSYCDRPKFFQDYMYLLLCGCGLGFSVQIHHIAKLPKIKKPSGIKKKFIIPDSIEGWADSIGVLLSSYFIEAQPFPEYTDRTIEFDFSQIRLKGAPLSHGAKAPGPEPLKRALELIKILLDDLLVDNNPIKLLPINCYDINMHLADAVISGGHRRSATIALFSPTDVSMATAKTGDWFIKNPQRGRSNNSAVLLRDSTTFEEFQSLMQNVKEFGEPGYIWCDSTEVGFNPCAEACLYPVHEETGETGFQFCNLSSINAKKCKTEEDFYNACKGAAILGTLQAGYTNFPYLGKVSEDITKREALLGVSITGMMDSPEIVFNPDIQKRGAELVILTNKQLAKKLKINPAARCCVLKPEGTSSCLLGTSSGIHPHHAKRYFRRVQANELEPTLQHFIKYNPMAVEDSVWDPNKVTKVITFVCEVPDGSKIKNQTDAITLLEYVKLTQQNWIEHGTNHEMQRQPWLRHAVSNTIHVQPHEWEIVTKFIFDNRQFFAGISLLPAGGDKEYDQAPFTTVYTDNEILKEYGKGSLLASGLIVDGLYAFDNNLWKGCDCLLGIGEDLLEQENRLLKTKYKDDLSLDFVEGFSGYPLDLIPEEYHEMVKLQEKKDWIRRAKQFANRYLDGDLKKTVYCLKDVCNWKLWLDLNREYIDVPWSEMIELQDNTKLQHTVSCAGGSCEIL